MNLKRLIYEGREIIWKSHSEFRTVSPRKRAGRRNNKPKYSWGKKRRRVMGWKV